MGAAWVVGDSAEVTAGSRDTLCCLYGSIKRVGCRMPPLLVTAPSDLKTNVSHSSGREPQTGQWVQTAWGNEGDGNLSASLLSITDRCNICAQARRGGGQIISDIQLSYLAVPLCPCYSTGELMVKAIQTTAQPASSVSAPI